MEVAMGDADEEVERCSALGVSIPSEPLHTSSSPPYIVPSGQPFGHLLPDRGTL